MSWENELDLIQNTYGNTNQSKNGNDIGYNRNNLNGRDHNESANISNQYDIEDEYALDLDNNENN